MATAFGFALLWIASCCAVAEENTDPNTALREAQRLTQQGKYEEALEKHLWYHENALRLDPHQVGVRVSFALMYWMQLGEKYPKAREALVAIRDKDLKAFDEGNGSSQLFQDVAAINRELGESAKTVELFKSVEAKQPELAKKSYLFAEETLAAHQEYKICSRYVADPLEQFERLKKLRDLGAKQEQPAELKRAHDAVLVEKICHLITILANADRKPEADQLQAKALAVFEDEKFAAKIRRAGETAEMPPAK